MITRRRFVELGSTLAAASALACDNVPPQLGALLSTGAGPFPPPAGDDVDLITHAVGRLSFGLRPGDHARVRSLEREPERAVERYIDAQLSPDAIDDKAADARLARYAELGDSPGELYEVQGAGALEPHAAAL
jgi:hypothetical protein